MSYVWLQKGELRPMYGVHGRKISAWFKKIYYFPLLIWQSFWHRGVTPHWSLTSYIKSWWKVKPKLVPCLCRLEGGCNNDYIEVFDGPYHSSPLIARVCDVSSGSFISSSNFMSVRFVSDGSITRRGFQAEYYSSPSNDSTSKSPSRGLFRDGGTSESLLLL